jgi:hypothetical protein
VTAERPDSRRIHFRPRSLGFRAFSLYLGFFDCGSLETGELLSRGI